MSERRYGEKAIVLSFRDETLKDLDESEYKAFVDKLTRNLFSLLRRNAKANNWSYRVFMCGSIMDGGTKKRERLHIHLFLQANPSSTIEMTIRQYWQDKKKYGLARTRDGYNAEYYVSNYMNPQALISKEQSVNFD